LIDKDEHKVKKEDGDHEERMGNDEYVCQKCALKVAPGDVKFHGVRGGYSSAHFPLFHFVKVPMCHDCQLRQQKIDVFEKILAIIALGIVLYFMVLGFYILFSLGS